LRRRGLLRADQSLHDDIGVEDRLCHFFRRPRTSSMASRISLSITRAGTPLLRS
jgi:hypothetical protein